MTTPSGVPVRPLLPGLYHVVPMTPDRVVVANARRMVALSGPGFTARVTPFLTALDGTSTAEELEARFPEFAPAVLGALSAKGLLVDAGSADRSSPGPKLAALALPGAPSPAVAVTRLASATVVVVGCAAVGGAVAVLLAKAGAGRLVLADGDAVAERDVAVSPVLQPSDAGRGRAEAVARQCRDAGATVEFADPPADAIRPDLAVVQLAYGTAGNAADQFLAGRIPYLVHSQDALEAGVGPLVWAPGDPCHRCLATRRLGHVAHGDEYLAYVEHRAATSPTPDAFLAAQVAVVAGLVAAEALRALLDADPLSRGAFLALDLARPTVVREVLLPVPGCPGCSTSPVGAER
ncbi:MAG TPA: TOMM precursor leader peptide-binding protein [Acidimicrobiales bacterium]|nr:TOMM precursor leader peptide-binding protein [Acidimicrobiales bacterium]